MNVFVILKCGLKDSFDFITQISNVQGVDNVLVFRDECSLENPKVKYFLPKFKSFSLLKNFYRLLQVINKKSFKPKIIIGIYELPHGLLAMLAGKVLGIPSAVSIIGNPAYEKVRKGLWMKTMLWIMKHTSFVTVTGNKSKEFLVSKGINENKLFVLPNTLDFSGFVKIPNFDKKYDIVSLGRISEEKHVELIVRVIAKLITEIPSLKAGIAGTGPEIEKIKTLVTELNLNRTIDILGFIPDNQLSEFFNSGKVFLLTSETEGFPRTIVQAAACGVPIVASNVGDMTDIIEDGVNGFLVEKYNNVDEYTYKVSQLLGNEKLCNQLADKLSDKVKDRFAHSRATEVWSKILNQ